MGIYTARRERTGDHEEEYEIVAHHQGDILCFPYVEGENEVSCKYRQQVRGERRFWQRAGGRKTFFNANVLDDPALTEVGNPLVVTEGEPDCLVALQCVTPFAVSVPDGAPATRDNLGRPIAMRPDSELDPATDDKFSYVFNNWERLSRVKRFVLATDGDEQGQRLRDELARRLGRVRCLFIEYPPDKVVDDVDGARACKDLNEVLVKFGAARVTELIAQAKPYPVSGLYQLDDFAEEHRDLYQVGFDPLFDRLCLWLGALVITSGLPGAGKSQVWLQIAFNMAWAYGWRIAIASFEADVKPDVQRQLRFFFIRKSKSEWTAEDVQRADQFIRERFCFITRDPSGSNDETCSLAWLIDRLDDAVIRFGIKMSLTDPWNEIDHVRQRGQQRDEYLNDALRDLKDFGRRRRIVNVVVAHPTKSAHSSTKEGHPISLYDISDGAAWANKADVGVIIHRPSAKDLATEVHVKKVKFRHHGKVGTYMIYFDEMIEQFQES